MTEQPHPWPDTSAVLWKRAVASLQQELMIKGHQSCALEESYGCQKVSLLTMIGQFVPVPLCRNHQSGKSPRQRRKKKPATPEGDPNP